MRSPPVLASSLASFLLLCILLLLAAGCVYSTQSQTFEGATVTIHTTGKERVTGTDSVIGIGTQVSVPKRENLMDMLKGSAAASVALPGGTAGEVAQTVDQSGVRPQAAPDRPVEIPKLPTASAASAASTASTESTESTPAEEPEEPPAAPSGGG